MVGIDGMFIDEFLVWVKVGYWKMVENDLKIGYYWFFLVRCVEIDKFDGGKC